MLFAAAVLASYVVEASRPATATENRAADVALLLVVGWLGIVLVCGDTVTDRSRLDVLVSRMTTAVGWLAALGIVQFFTHHTFVDALQVPGLSVNNGVATVQSRDGFSRVIGTAIHPIEFGVITAAMLPLCVYHAQRSPGGPLRRWAPTVAVSIAIPLSVSRSAVVAMVVALLCVVPTWSSALRRSAAAYAVVLVCATFVLVPGMLGTLVKLFTGVSEDSSALSRTNSYAVASDFISRSPWLGRGFMTFLPQYNTNDNQYLGLLIEVGVVGTLAMLTVFVTGVAVAVNVRRRSRDEDTRSLAAALGASITSIAVTFAFFDALSFPMLAGVTFLLLGITEALRRLEPTVASPVP
ncbi:O-antigen ligase family protein [Nocardioides sp. MAHUQ-72]|uniref:O-antigen ligase family protein n=1 Tax=unclassified Nocardioides TaxID=2615069 RepID=UPI0036205D35